MKLLWLTQNYPPSTGGMSVSCDRIVRNLRQKGVDIDLYHLKAHSNQPISVLFQDENLGTDRSFMLGDKPAHGLNLLWLAIEQEAIQYDAIIGYGFPYAMHATKIFSAWLRCPLISCIRGNDFDINILSPKSSPILLDLLNSSQSVLTVSQDKADRIQALLPSLNVHCVGNGIDARLWLPTQWDHQQAEKHRLAYFDERHVLGIIGHLKDKKGLHFLVNLLSKKHWFKQFKLLIIGELDEDAQVLIQSLSPDDYYQVDSMDRLALIPWYMTCDLVAIPSFYDGLPNVVMEAGLLNVPVLAAHCGGMRDRLNANNAYLFAPNKAQELHQALTDFVQQMPQDRQLKAEFLQKEIRQHCCAQQEAQRYYEQLNAVIQTNSTEISSSLDIHSDGVQC